MHLHPRPSSRHRALAALAAALLVIAFLSSATRASAAWSEGGSLPGLKTGRIWSVAASQATAGVAVAGTDNGVYTTTDFGATWSGPTLAGKRVWVVGFDARNAQRLFAGTDGTGIDVSTDAGASWTNVSTGLTNRTVRSMAFGLDGIAAGTDSGIALSPDGTTWHNAGLAGDSVAAVAVAANSPNLVLVAGIDGGPDLSNGYLFRYGSSGATWQPLQSGLANSAVISSVSAGPLSSAVAKRPLVVTTNKGTYRSGDSGDTWTASTGIPEALTLTAAVFSPLDPNLVYAGADAGGSHGGDLLRSTDGGATFGVADQGLPTTVRQVETIAVAQVTPPTVIAGLDPGSGGVAFTETDVTAPAPPALVAEAAGQVVPATLTTAAPTAAPSRAATPSPVPATQGAFSRLVGSAFHFPMPLVLEILFVLLVAYIFVRWRQRYYVEGPP
jgi:hypothetical protein